MSPELQKVLGQAYVPELTADSIKPALLLARSRISQYLLPSPLIRSTWLSEELNADVWLKLECLNPNGSFKVRGALNAIQAIQIKQGKSVKICAASAGNHAQGVAYAAKRLGCEAHIFLPKRTPMVKRDATERLGATVYLVGDVLDDAFEAAVTFARTDQAILLHAFNDFDVIAGQASCALEAMEQFQTMTGKHANVVNEFVTCLGGGGLVAGAGLALKYFYPETAIHGVEQQFFDSAFRSLAMGQRLEISQPGLASIADGIAVRMIGNVTYEIMKHNETAVSLVSDDDLVGAALGLCEREHVVAEGAGAAAVAALLKNKQAYDGKTVIATVSGGNIDPQLLSRVIARGLVVTGRMLLLTARMGDRPGQLKRLLEEIANLDANVLEVIHDRTYSQVNVGNVEVELALETRNSEHQYEILSRLEELQFSPKVRNR